MDKKPSSLVLSIDAVARGSGTIRPCTAPPKLTKGRRKKRKTRKRKKTGSSRGTKKRRTKTSSRRSTGTSGSKSAAQLEAEATRARIKKLLGITKRRALGPHALPLIGRPQLGSLEQARQRAGIGSASTLGHGLSSHGAVPTADSTSSSSSSSNSVDESSDSDRAMSVTNGDSSMATHDLVKPSDPNELFKEVDLLAVKTERTILDPVKPLLPPATLKRSPAENGIPAPPSEVRLNDRRVEANHMGSALLRATEMAQKGMLNIPGLDFKDSNDNFERPVEPKSEPWQPSRSAPKDDDVPTSASALRLNERYVEKLHRQERANEEVKLALKPYYKKEITKEEYKEIMRKAVFKVCHSKSGSIRPDKVRKLVEVYIHKVKHARKKSKRKAKDKAHSQTLEPQTSQASSLANLFNNLISSGINSSFLKPEATLFN